MADMDDPGTQNTKMWLIAAGLVAVIAAGAGAWWYLHRTPKPAAPEVVADAAETAAPPAAEAPPAIEHPIAPAADAASAPPLPAVADSDPALTAALQGLIGAAAVQTWLVPDQLARRFVATVDNLPRNASLEKRRPLQAPTDSFIVDRTTVDQSTGTERITLSARNAARYDAAVALFQKADTKQVAELYRRYYPLLQQAYEDLGFPDRYFNDRMIAAIDDMLRAPEIDKPITLTQPKVLYQYEDPALEQLSSGQKLLVRMGLTHERNVKAKLRELRALIATPPKK
ncbi:MAG TPA: DUF3014 domain-containing protein [Steroidobacteraceae bacterium]|nr:DUF3014 domain-containing protein [Steroidobacteraceae bacterium]